MIPSNVPMPTRAELKRFAPKIHKDYLDAILSLEDEFRAAGVLDDKLTLVHFLAQFGAETNGGQIIRENMHYTSVRRIRQVWPARYRRRSDAWIQANLVRNAKRLACDAYGGRMGNKKWPSTDGYDYRGGGMLQTTGKSMTARYCKKIGIDCTPDVLDDCAVTTRFALYEWKQTNCNKYACENDLLSVSKIINTGSATSGVRPNGMEHRRRWLKRAWAVFGDDRKYIPEASTLTVKDLRKKGSETVGIGDVATTGAVVTGVASGSAGVASETAIVAPPAPPPTPDVAVEVIDKMKTVNEQVDVVTTVTRSVQGLTELVVQNYWVAGCVFSVAAIYLGVRLNNRRTRDARLSQNVAYLDRLDPVDDSLVDPEDAVIPRR